MKHVVCGRIAVDQGTKDIFNVGITVNVAVIIMPFPLDRFAPCAYFYATLVSI